MEGKSTALSAAGILISVLTLLFPSQVTYWSQLPPFFVFLAGAALAIKGFIPNKESRTRVKEKISGPLLFSSQLPSLKNNRDKIYLGKGYRIEASERAFVGSDIFRLRANVNEDVYLSNRRRNLHTLILGGTGYGKTNLATVMALQDIQRGAPVIFIDPKGELKNLRLLKAWAEEHGRTFNLVSPFSYSIEGLTIDTWNPLMLARNALEAQELMISIFDVTREAEYYKSYAYKILGMVLRILYSTEDFPPTIAEIHDMIFSPRTLKQFEDKIKTAEARDLMQMLKKEMARPGYREDVQNLEILLEQISGDEVMRRNLSSKNPSLDLYEAIKNGHVVYFYLPATTIPEASNMIGRLVLASMQYIFGQFVNNGKFIQTFLYVDELQTMLFSGILNLFRTSRAGGLSITAMVQSVAALAVKLSHEGARDLITNTATHFYLSTNDREAQRNVAELLGKTLRIRYDERVSFDEGLSEEADRTMYSAATEYDYIIDPSILGQLKEGEAFMISGGQKYFLKTCLVDLRPVENEDRDQAFRVMGMEEKDEATYWLA